jgi:hypothetical protein
MMDPGSKRPRAEPESTLVVVSSRAGAGLSPMLI